METVHGIFPDNADYLGVLPSEVGLGPHSDIQLGRVVQQGHHCDRGRAKLMIYILT